jgi:hypothetical protein
VWVRIGGNRRIPLPLIATACVIVLAGGLAWAVASAPDNSNEGAAVSAHVHSGASTADGAHVHADGSSHHHLGPATEVAISAATRRKLDVQLRAARASVQDIRTAADAMARGYSQVTVDLAYLGVHYMNPAYVGKPFDPAHPTHLIFGSDSPDAPLIGLMYYIDKVGSPPAGFAGPNDLWHVHLQACMNEGFMLALDDISPDQCSGLGGTMTPLGAEFANRWMVHVWVVPGQENPWGLFANGDPILA